MRYKWEQWNTTSVKQKTERTQAYGQTILGNTYNGSTTPYVATTYYATNTSYTNWYYYPAEGNELIAHIGTDGDWMSLKSTADFKQVDSRYNNITGTIPAGNYFCAMNGSWNHSYNEFAIMAYAVTDTKVSTAKSYSGDSYCPRVDTNCLVYQIESINIKGDTKQKEYISDKADKFPDNGYYNADGIIGWFVLVGSDSITPASVALSRFHANGVVKVDIAPSANLTLGGTITYTIETTTDGTSWGKKVETTDTAITLYVPLNTTKFGVRVKASDDNGIVDDTYVYGNGVTTVTPETSDFLPYSGNIGYVMSKHILDATIASAQSFNLTATINGATVYSGTGVNGTNAITISDSAFAGLPENELIEITVKAELASGMVTRVYTFRKFDYDHTNLSGVFTGAAKALRNQTGDSAQILGANIPEEIMELPAYKLPEVTATPEKVTEGYIFIDSNGELKVGTAASSLRLRATETRNIRLYTTVEWSSDYRPIYSANVETLTVTPESKDKMCLITTDVDSKDQMLGFWAGISPAAIGIGQTVSASGPITGGSGGAVFKGIRCNSYSVTDESIVLKIQENAVGVSTFDTTYAITIKYYE